jgi:hypothetical protein
MSKTTTTPTADSSDFKNLVDLMAIYTECTARLAKMAADCQDCLIEAVDERRAEYADLQEKLSQAEASMEILARRHPEWFGNKRSLKTPYGTVKFHASTKLDVPNEEASIILIEQHATEEQRKQFLRTETTLNLDALKTLTDAQLAQFRIHRVADDNFGVKPATIDLGKAVEKAEEAAA